MLFSSDNYYEKSVYNEKTIEIIMVNSSLLSTLIPNVIISFIHCDSTYLHLLKKKCKTEQTNP